MPQQYFNQTRFNAGQLSFRARKRSDLDTYQKSVKESQNFIPEVHGPLTKRPGTKYTGTQLTAADVRLEAFIYSGTEAFTLEFSNNQLRILDSDGAVLDTVTTTITTAMLPDFHFAQNGDIVYITHPTLAPQELIRLADDNWVIHALGLLPGPTFEAGFEGGVDTTLAAASGTGVNWTADSGTPFRESDLNRFVAEIDGPGFAVVTSVTSTTVLVLDILTTFSTTDLDDGQWRILGSPAADLWISETGPPGTVVTMNLHNDIDDTGNSELLTNGDFSSGLTGWDDHSRPVVATGTTTSAGSNTDLDIIDNTATFITWGVQENYTMTKDSTGGQEFCSAVISETQLQGETGKVDWGNSVAYTISQTGNAFVDNNNKLILNGERNGIGWLEQDVTSLDTNRIYALKFRIEDSPVAMQIGSASKASDIVNEKSYEIGEHEVYFLNLDSTIYVQFRNNQFTNASVVEASLKLVDITGFHSTDVGKFIRTLGGLVEITTVDANNTLATGIIRADLVAAETDIDVRVVSGLWTLESNAWSAPLGYSRVAALHAQRPVFGSTTTFPATLWGSQIRNFKNFNKGEGNDDESWEIVPTTSEVNQLQWLISEHNLMCGTGRNEFIIGAGLEGTITPTNRKVNTPSHWGSINHRPIRVGDAVLFIERNAASIREIITDPSGDVRSNNDITLMASGIADAGIKKLAYQQRPTPTIWALLQDGTVLSGSYLKEQDVIGWVAHNFKDRVQSLTVIPNGTVDQVWLAVERTTGTYNIEFIKETGGIYGALVTDSTIEYNDISTSTITGLNHLEGRTVVVANEDNYFGTFVVASGQITLPADVIRCEVGLAIVSTATFLRPDNPQMPTTGYEINAVKVAPSLYQSIGGIFNGQENFYLWEYPFEVEGKQLFTGTLSLRGFNGQDGVLPEIDLLHDEPGPFTLQALTYIIERSDM